MTLRICILLRERIVMNRCRVPAVRALHHLYPAGRAAFSPRRNPMRGTGRLRKNTFDSPHRYRRSLIDVAMSREPHVAASSELLSAIEDGKAAGFVAWHSLSNVHYLLSPRHGSGRCEGFSAGSSPLCRCRANINTERSIRDGPSDAGFRRRSPGSGGSGLWRRYYRYPKYP